MAKVAMDLNELKALETKIDNLERDNQNLIDNQKMVVVLHKYFTGVAKPGVTKDGSLRITGIRRSREYGGGRDWGGMRGVDYMGKMISHDYREESFDNEVSISDAISRGWVDVILTEDDTRHSREYINLNEVKEELRVLTGAEYDQKIEELRDRANKAEYELSAIDDKHLKRLRSLTESYQNDVVKIHKEHDAEMKALTEKSEKDYDDIVTEYNELREDYNDLKEDKQRVSLQENYNKLSEEIYKLRTRSFWQRIINKI